MKYIFRSFMRSTVLIPASFLILTFAHGQIVRHAPDLIWSDELRSFLGFANPENRETEVIITGYAENGAPLGSRSITLPPYGRFEASAVDLFEDSTIAWASLESEVLVAGYVRYLRLGVGERAMAPLVDVAGRDVWVPQPGDLPEGYHASVALVNVSDLEGTATITPIVAEEDPELLYKVGTSLEIPAFGAPRAKVRVDHNELFKDAEAQVWHRISSGDGPQLAAVQHLESSQALGLGMASIALPRTPFRKMVLAPMQPGDGNFWNKLVLINTFPGFLPVVLTAHYEFGYSRSFNLELEPYEKRVVDIISPTQLDLPSNATWYEVTPYEGGLLGFQIFGEENGFSVAAAEAAVSPGTISVLPYTPTSTFVRTEVGIVNMSDISVPVYLAGFNDAGKIVALKTNIRLEAGEKKVLDMETAFGEKAPQITWTRVSANRDLVLAYSVVRGRKGGGLAAFQGVANIARDGQIFAADFEHIREISLDEQCWRGKVFSLPLKHTFNIPPNFGNYLKFNPVPGSFFAEDVHGAESGFFFVGYEPLYSKVTTYFLDGGDDAVAFMSPYFEVPHIGSYHLSYFMRFLNPETATRHSEFGLVWHEEGSNQWHWFGLKGLVLLDPPLTIRDCWVPIQYRNQMIVTITPWLPFEAPLPESTRGKRIQVGLYYNYKPNQQTLISPHLFIDRIRLAIEPLPFSHHFGRNGEGDFIFEEEP